MWTYEKRLQYPVSIKNPNPALAKLIIAQYGGPDGEIGASLRYLSQRYTMPYPELKAILTDIGISVSILHIRANGFRLFHTFLCLLFTEASLTTRGARFAGTVRAPAGFFRFIYLCISCARSVVTLLAPAVLQ